MIELRSLYIFEIRIYRSKVEEEKYDHNNIYNTDIYTV